MSGFATRVVKLDNTGKGVERVGPGLYFGCAGATGVQNAGDDLGTILLTPATAKFVVGEVDVEGPANAEAALYFNFG
jgi:hypothetical protein